ncbi:hypothetical protein ES705_37116 [subsurface metagenome]
MLPVLRFYDPAGVTEQTTHNFYNCDAGAYKPDANGWEVWIWNDKGGSSGSDDMTSVKISIRDADGKEVKIWTKQHWVEIKSYGVSSPSNTFIGANVDTGTEIITVGIDIATGKKIRFTTTGALPDPLIVGTTYFAIRVDDTRIKVAATLIDAIALAAMNLTTGGTGTHTVTVYIEDDAKTSFRSVGLNKPSSLGDIPSNCARKLFIRCYPPTDAEEQDVSFQLIATYQKPSTSIMKWLTGLFGNGVVNMLNKLLVTDNAGDDSVIDIASGYALIDDNEIYFGSTQTHTISIDSGVYKIYLTHTGVIGSIIGSIPANSIQLATVVISDEKVDSVTDTRPFISYPVSRVVCQHFQDLLAANPSGIHAPIPGTGVSQDITTVITNPDYARNASITTTEVSSPSGVVTLTGLVRGIEDTEAFTIIPGGTAYGNKAFDTITNINIPAGVFASDTVAVGFSDKIGLANPIVAANAVYKKKVNNEDKTSELSENVDATCYTVNCATIVANEDMEIRYNVILTL